MKKKLRYLIVALAACLSMYAVTNMSVKLDDGQILKFDVNRVLEVSFETSANDTTIIPPVDTSVVDITDTPLKFEILSNSTVEVVQGNYKDLNSVNIPSKVKIDGKVYNVTSIGDNTFKDCNNLASITIPKSVISIGNYAFYGCDKLTPHLLTYDNGTKCYGWVGNRDSCVNVVIPGSVTSIGDYAFYSCSGLKNITIPKRVTSIGEFAFSLCVNLDVVIENSEENVKVGYAAFNGCKSVTYTKNPPVDTSVVDITDTPLNFVILSDSTVAVLSISNCPDSVNIPSKVRIDGIVYNVTSIEGNAFWSLFSCSSWITTISIPESVTSIGSSAFSGCSSLTTISIPEGVTSIGDYAFSGCDKLTPHLLTYDNGTKCYGWVGDRDSCVNIVIPEGVTSIGSGAFSGCSSLTTISIPESVTSIGSSAFSGCSSLTSISIPEGVTSIGYDAFGGCSSLSRRPSGLRKTSVNYNSLAHRTTWLRSDLSWAFSGCSSLTSISIPEGVTSIGYDAFGGCSSLTSISIPESVSSIGDGAFSGCYNLDIVVDNVKANVEYSPLSFNGCKSVKFKDGQLSFGINISLVEGSEYSVSNPSLDLSFTFKVTSATGHYTTCDQVVNLLINYKGKSTAITLRDEGASYLIWTKTEGFNVVNKNTALAMAKDVVLYLTCNYNSNSDYTIKSPMLNETLKSAGASETFFVLKN